MKKIKKALDINNDGKVDHKDAMLAVSMVGVGAAGVATTAAAAAVTGSAIVAAKSTAIATGIATACGAAAGAAATAGASSILAPTTFFVAECIAGVTAGGVTIFESVSIASATTGLSATASAVVSGAGALTGAATGAVSGAIQAIAGMPVIESMALSVAEMSGSVVVIGGIPFSVTTALAVGLLSAVVVAGIVYFLLNQGVLDDHTDDLKDWAQTVSV
jgi:hypothetical protein